MHAPLITQIDQNTTILTANRRLATYLSAEYAKIQHKQGHTAWQNPHILPLASWLDRYWDLGQLSGVLPPLLLLNPQQEQQLWEQILSDSAIGQNLLQHSETSHSLQQAWQFLQAWDADPFTPYPKLTEDAQAFRTLAQTFIDHCEQEGWIDTTRAQTLIIAAIKAHQLPLPPHMIFTGFDELSPQTEHLITALRQHTKVKIIDPLISFHFPAHEITVQAYPDTQHELYAMAQWAQQLLQDGCQPIVCVVPNLAEIRTQVQTIFTRVLAPASLFPGAAAQAIPFNIAGGDVLANTAVIHTALALLQLQFGERPLAEFSHVLRSPFVGDSEQEYAIRAQLDYELREIGVESANIDTLHYLLRRQKQFPCASLIRALHELKDEVAPEHLSPSEWAEYFAQQLVTWGWPGERQLNSTEYQQVQRWQELLQELALHDHITKQIDRYAAYQLLQRLAQHTVFQPQTGAEPIQILGVLEATGQQFAATWIMGLHDGAWPTAPTPNPFIPLQQQRQYNMPHSSHTREFNFCQRLTERLCDSAPIVILSYPQQHGDEHLRPSPLIKRFQLSATSPVVQNTLAYTLQRLGQLETLQDDTGPIIPPHEKTKGGSGLFKDQAACPFRAFARYRLGAFSTPSFTRYLTAQDRGILLHQILERLWSHLENQQQLLVLPESQLQKLCDAIITTALNTLPTLKPKFRQLEHARLHQIVQTWLTHEKARPPFTVVAREQWRQAEIGGIQVRLQVDRIDKINLGAQEAATVIIDYKTGKTSLRGWLGERPDEPQLPLYTVTHEEPIAGTVFATLRPDQMGYSGIAKIEGLIPSVPAINEFEDDEIPATWSELLANWRKELEQLAAEFRQGYAAVAPKYGAQTCQYCDLAALCRVK